jgi:hypothetical protein
MATHLPQRVCGLRFPALLRGFLCTLSLLVHLFVRSRVSVHVVVCGVLFMGGTAWPKAVDIRISKIFKHAQKEQLSLLFLCHDIYWEELTLDCTTHPPQQVCGSWVHPLGDLLFVLVCLLPFGTRVCGHVLAFLGRSCAIQCQQLPVLKKCSSAGVMSMIHINRTYLNQQ